MGLRLLCLPKSAVVNRLTSDQKKEFLSEMAKRHEDWQVKQADTALRLYDYFLANSVKPLVGGPGSPGSSAEAWRPIEDKLREALRLRHRSLSTEKTYLVWFRSFGRFVGEKQPDELRGRDLQDFLSHLAFDKKVSSSTRPANPSRPPLERRFPPFFAMIFISQ